MKVIEKYEIEYVVPESEEERLEIQKIIDDVKIEEKDKKFDPSKLNIIKPKHSREDGYWKKSEKSM